ncbi:MAG: hypothetical protein IM318_11310 [Microcystis sp. M017S1]|jgi:hypothetical protein|uniref:hypothetical protein n=1 Tax=Microcystis sp. M017S1 TaxID=2771107 RepID=UPI002589C825|nr:hypothetical protein [Microcystis sp. M017S1]MCA2918247.1 hypothetical protein [Microcystis sp. M017S1]MCA3173512.1 hypothetical protein [Burkholderiales bacterium]
MTGSENAGTLEDRFESAIFRFSASLSDLREFSELVESLIKTHKLKELEKALTRYEGLGDALCHFDSDLKTDISSIQNACTDESMLPNASLKFEVGENDKGKKVLRAAGSKEELKEFDKSIGTILKTENSVQHLHRSSLISLVSLVESFLSQLLHMFFQKHPSALNAKEKQFTFEELSNFSSLYDARSYLVSWKIENLLRGSYEDWIEYFRTQVKLELSVTTRHQERLVENFQRRNLFVHNGGVVNKIYLSKVAKSITKPEMLNKKLGVSKDYLFSAIDRFESSFLQLAFELWAKCEKNSKKRPSLIVHSTYDALQNKRWHVATELAEIVEKDKAASEINILMAKVNSWIARKKFDDKDKIFEEVNGFDVSAKDDLFKLAKHCLLDEIESGLSLAKRLEKAKQLSVSNLNEWPLFEDLRATPQMKAWLAQIKSKTEKRKTKAASKPNSEANTNSDSATAKAVKTPRPRKARSPNPENV